VKSIDVFQNLLGFVRDLNETIDRLSISVQNIETKVQNIDSKVEENADHFGKLKANAETTNEQLQKIDSKLKSTGFVRDLNETIDRLTISVQNIETKVENIFSKTGEISSKVEGNPVQFQKLQANAETTKKQLQEMDSKLKCTVCPDGWSNWKKNGKCYTMFKESLTWMKAQYNCKIHGGDLAIIHDDETNNFITSLSLGLTTWIGLRRTGNLVDPKPRNDQWTWIDGSPIVGKGHWKTNEPNNSNYNNEACGMMNHGTVGTWNDAPCHQRTKGYICQK